MLGKAFFYAVCVAAGYGLYAIINTVTDFEPPLVYIEASTDMKDVRIGDQLEVKFDVYRNRICSTDKINRYIVDSQGITNSVTNYTVSSTTRPGRERYDRLITIPPNINDGRAYYYVQITYSCTWVHKLFTPIIITSPRIYFNILPALHTRQDLPLFRGNLNFGHDN